MMRSMFSGVSGLRAHQTRMDVIGNNIANVNTVGFKSSRVLFQEVFSQTLQGAGAPDPTTNRGGTNPKQIGLGIGVGAIDTQFTTGSPQRTDYPGDLSIEGNGFFVVRAGNNGSYTFTRAGNFDKDSQGNFIQTGSGLNVYGWQDYDIDNNGNYVFNTTKPVEQINLYLDTYNGNKKIMAPEKTSKAPFAGNLDSGAAVVTAPTTTAYNPVSDPAPAYSTSMTVYDNLGNDYEIKMNFWKSASTPTTWTWQIANPANAPAGAIFGTLQFDNNGKMTTSSVNSLTFTPTAAMGSAPFTVNLDFKNLTMFAASSTVKASGVDGYPTGQLQDYSIGADGIITGVYSNGRKKPLGMVALASFENPAGLQKVGNNLFTQTPNSGNFSPTMGVKPGNGDTGALSPGTLEMSNVDLSREFTDMIVTQRGFQANSRIITTSDEMLQELVNLKR